MNYNACLKSSAPEEGWGAWRMNGSRVAAGRWQWPCKKPDGRLEEARALFCCCDLLVGRLARTRVGERATNRRRDIHDSGCRSWHPVACAKQTSRGARQL